MFGMFVSVGWIVEEGSGYICTLCRRYLEELDARLVWETDEEYLCSLVERIGEEWGGRNLEEGMIGTFCEEKLPIENLDLETENDGTREDWNFIRNPKRKGQGKKRRFEYVALDEI